MSGIFLDTTNDRLDKEGREGDLCIFPFLEFFFHFIPPLNEVGDICLGEAGDVRAGVFAANHMIGYQPAHPVHLHDLDIAGIGGRNGVEAEPAAGLV